MTSTGPARPVSWVVGRGGLLGRHLEPALAEHGEVWRPPERVPWGNPSAATILTGHARAFLESDAVRAGRPWQVLWVAGSGVTGSSEEELGAELDLLAATLDTLAGQPGRRGAVFLASSAGGVYAGVGEPPYDEASPVRPLAAYGRAKLAAEAMVARWAHETGQPALVGRIANLYGPGQNLAKQQGLISQLCRSYLTAQPLSVYVSLDTLRDYLYAPDCARLVVDGLERTRVTSDVATGTPQPGVVTKVLASQRAVTIGAILGEMRRMFKRPPRITVASAPTARLQARDLSLRSRVWPELDRAPLTPLPVGLLATAADLRRQLQVGRLVAR